MIEGAWTIIILLALAVGMIYPRYGFSSIFVVVVFYLLVGCAMAAETPGRPAWFKSLQRPDVGGSCCDVADCRRTEAEWRDDQWWALVPKYPGTQSLEWTPIPPEKIVRHPRSIDGDAYVCAGVNRFVFCFVPPDMGY